MNKSVKIVVSTLLFFIFSIALKAAAPPPPPPPSTGSTPPCWPPPCVPIDGGISILAVAGAAYAGKKLYEKRKKNSAVSDII